MEGFGTSCRRGPIAHLLNPWVLGAGALTPCAGSEHMGRGGILEAAVVGFAQKPLCVQIMADHDSSVNPRWVFLKLSIESVSPALPATEP